MLVLSRKSNQEIVIGDQIRLTVLKVKGNQVRIGIDAPDHIRIVRGELKEKSSDSAAESNESSQPTSVKESATRPRFLIGSQRKKKDEGSLTIRFSSESPVEKIETKKSGTLKQESQTPPSVDLSDSHDGLMLQ